MTPGQVLIKKYDVPAPRYTSYPTVPFWDDKKPSLSKWWEQVKKVFDQTNEQKGISLYLHLPFCESLCTYCGCNKRITRNHKVEEEYIRSLLAEWQRYLEHFDQRPQIRELHLGGGTPTFFSPENLRVLLEGILSPADMHPELDFGFEGHPNNTTQEHLQTLFDLGFRRVSFGVQDLDPRVQKVINRIQPFEKVKEVTDTARDVGYGSVNFDLIYGLPLQTLDSIQITIKEVGELRPDRIAFYSYAHVPWKAPSQRGYDESDLPDSKNKRILYEYGKEQLLKMGYIEIGMDHFALPEDPLAVAFKNKTLHRNFMGYTTCNTNLLIGLGVSAISDAGLAYVQNIKTVEAYQEQVAQNDLALDKGYFLTDTDYLLRNFITTLICNSEARLTASIKDTLDVRAWSRLQTMEQEGLLDLSVEKLTVTTVGQAFIRNICMVFDQKLQTAQRNSAPLFSKAI